MVHLKLLSWYFPGKREFFYQIWKGQAKKWTTKVWVKTKEIQLLKIVGWKALKIPSTNTNLKVPILLFQKASRQLKIIGITDRLVEFSSFIFKKDYNLNHMISYFLDHNMYLKEVCPFPLVRCIEFAHFF